MGLKTLESGNTSVRIPTEIRLALRNKRWTILQAIKNGLKYSATARSIGVICERPECVNSKRRLARLLVKYGDDEN
tara:strand:- start:1677 stop:1904 length:228 start_codon:yes stop_codon:yes gene_type:complete